MDLQITFTPNLSLTNTCDFLKSITAPSDNWRIKFLQLLAILLIGPTIQLLIDRLLHYALCRLTQPLRNINYRPTTCALWEFVCAFMVAAVLTRDFKIHDPVRIAASATMGAFAVKSGLVIGILLMRVLCVVGVWFLRKMRLVGSNSGEFEVRDVEKGSAEHFEERFEA